MNRSLSPFTGAVVSERHTLCVKHWDESLFSSMLVLMTVPTRTGRTDEMVMTGKELKEAISSIAPKVLDVAAFKEGLKAANPGSAEEIDELFSGVGKKRAKSRE